MFDLQLLHSYEICKSALFFHPLLQKLYQNYLKQNPCPKEEYPYQKKELNEKLYRVQLENFDFSEEEYFTKYEKLPELLEYMFQIDYLGEKQLSTRIEEIKNTVQNPKQPSYMLADSRLLGFQIDHVHGTCSVGFSGAVKYAGYDKEDLQPYTAVEVIDLVFLFDGVSNVEIHGTLYGNKPELHRVLYSDYGKSEKEENKYIYEILIPVGAEGFILAVTFTDFTVEEKPCGYYENEKY